MKRFIVFFILPLTMFAYSVDILESGVTKDVIDNYRYIKLGGNQNIEDSEIKKVIDRSMVFAKAYLKEIDKEKRLEVDFFINTYLANAYQKSHFESIAIEDKVLKSYYELYKSEKYAHLDVLDLYTLKFSSLENLNKFKKESNLDKKLLSNKQALGYRLSAYEGLPYDKINSVFRNHIDMLKEFELSEPLKYGDDYYLVYYFNKRDAGIYPFDSVKESIRAELVAKKRDELLDEAYNKLKALESSKKSDSKDGGK